MYPRVSSAAALAAILFIAAPGASSAGDQDTPPRPVVRLAQADGPMVITPQPNPDYPHAANPNALPPGESGYDAGGPGRWAGTKDPAGRGGSASSVETGDRR